MIQKLELIDTPYRTKEQSQHLRNLKHKLGRDDETADITRISDELDEHNMGTRKIRSKQWKDWVAENWKHRTRAVYAWIQRIRPISNTGDLHHNKEQPTCDAEERLKITRAEWDKMWQQGKDHKPRGGDNLKPITGDDIRKTLKRMSPHKALGADHWHPKELARLHHSFHDELAKLINETEKNGNWPEFIRQCITSLMPKPKAATESQLRPIGILPYIYRIWMTHRRSQQTEWVKQIYGTNLSATDSAFLTALGHEQGKHDGKTFAMILLYCSKAYERINHETSHDRLIQSGLPAQIANLIFSMYSGPRVIALHGRISENTYPRAGLIAGCSFAKDVLKVSNKGLHEQCHNTNIREYVDDLILDSMEDNIPTTMDNL